ncbi:hypothetical protein [Dictyobacter aurantiacus]|uniref:Uncharacterized protein n=1 Tax=Dictyobacter aurantiacus TaxID=1936993 RepID=A0A401ZH93_9CHLR|nr:hypothetical protein [Dictyobacter aurantiacus]GCE06163.1 hypothetical protein KDAU_34920 [Dictyobacter aurantiacus]
MSDLSQTQQWLEKNKDNAIVQILTTWITGELQRPMETVENIEIVPDNADNPTEIEVLVDFTDGSRASQKIQIEA